MHHSIDKLGRSHLMATPINGIELEINLAEDYDSGHVL